MTVINTNMSSLNAHNALSSNARGLSKVMEQLSTGKRINSAADDAAGIAIASRLTSQIRGLNQAIRNANDGIAMIQTAESATNEITNMLQRMREIAVQAANDTNSADDRTALKDEYNQLATEIDRIAQTTEWNGMNILNQPIVAEVVGVTGVAAASGVTQASVQGAVPVTETHTYTMAGLSAGQSITVGGLTVTASGTLTAAQVASAFTTGNVTNAARTGTATSGWTFASSASGTNSDEVVVTSSTTNSNVTDLGAATYNTAVTAVTAVPASGYFYYQLGTSNDTENQVAVAFGDFSLGGAVVEVDTVTNELSTSDDALSLITDLDASIQNVNSQRSNMGSYVNRFQYTIDNLSSVSSNAAGSRSRVEDTDYSIATAELAKRQIIQQAATAMLAQANQQPQAVLSLLK